MLHGDFYQSTQRYRKKLQTENINRDKLGKILEQRMDMEKDKTETSEIALFMLRPHFNLFSVPYTLN